MPAIVNEDVYPWNPCRQSLEEPPIFLISDEDLDMLFFELLAMRIDVYAEYPALGSKLLLPHLQRAAVGHTDFNNMNVGFSKARKVSIVNVEIVCPLEDFSPSVLREVLFEIVHDA